MLLGFTDHSSPPPQVPSCPQRGGLVQGCQSVCGGVGGFPDLKIKEFQRLKLSKFQIFKVSKLQSFKVSAFRNFKTWSFQVPSFQNSGNTHFKKIKLWDSQIPKIILMGFAQTTAVCDPMVAGLLFFLSSWVCHVADPSLTLNLRPSFGRHGLGGKHAKLSFSGWP